MAGEGGRGGPVAGPRRHPTGPARGQAPRPRGGPAAPRPRSRASRAPRRAQRSAGAGALALALALAGALALARPEATRADPFIVGLAGAPAMAKLRGHCEELGAPLPEPGWWMKSLFPGAAQRQSACRALRGTCRRVYGATIAAVAGDFSEAQLADLAACLGPDAVAYVEPDGRVFKAEGHLTVGPGGGEVYTRDAGPKQMSPKALQLQAMADELEGRLRGGDPAAAGFVPAEGDRLISAFAGERTQSLHQALWNLDRVDQRDLPLDGAFTFAGGPPPALPVNRSAVAAAGRGGAGRGAPGAGVTIYVVDSGLRRTHQEFAAWGAEGDRGASRASWGPDFVDGDEESEDCDGHGTHVAGTTVGRTVGLAKGAAVVGVRVLDCSGSGSISDVVAGLDWVAQHAAGPSIVTLSLGIALGQWSRSLEEAVRAVVRQGHSVVVASGNSAVDSCFVAPGNVEETITVAASDLNTKFTVTRASDREGIYRWSNTGECVDIFAPGVDIYSACGGIGRCSQVTDSAYTWASGTSMAVPLVAGVAAAYLGDHPGATPAEVKAFILGLSTPGKLQSPHLKAGTPNQLLYSRLGEGGRPVMVASDSAAAEPVDRALGLLLSGP